ncbi:MAG: hypothetical protein IJ146_04345, partial [Kiritimatiellae bacterium]|nr:hypothetical protein [Kiritimatiellia bacterium]
FLTWISRALRARCGSYSEGCFLPVSLNERILAFPCARGKAKVRVSGVWAASVFHPYVLRLETTGTTGKNNFFYGGQHARRFKNAARFRGKKKMLFLHVVFVVSNRTYRQTGKPRL